MERTLLSDSGHRTKKCESVRCWASHSIRILSARNSIAVDKERVKARPQDGEIDHHQSHRRTKHVFGRTKSLSNAPGLPKPPHGLSRRCLMRVHATIPTQGLLRWVLGLTSGRGCWATRRQAHHSLAKSWILPVGLRNLETPLDTGMQNTAFKLPFHAIRKKIPRSIIISEFRAMMRQAMRRLVPASCSTTPTKTGIGKGLHFYFPMEAADGAPRLWFGTARSRASSGADLTRHHG